MSKFHLRAHPCVGCRRRTDRRASRAPAPNLLLFVEPTQDASTVGTGSAEAARASFANVAQWHVRDNQREELHARRPLKHSSKTAAPHVRRFSEEARRRDDSTSLDGVDSAREPTVVGHSETWLLLKRAPRSRH